ncbi:response regulator transcription factor [Myceligenerans xiligouense]|uniref:response regulator transcription factor n=1 Tax=Myceligenerans xiligouense TaxID=253184 RepID=UPI003CCC6F70
MDLDLLTDRERDVALAVAEGMGNSEIARELYLSPSTVKSHLSSALTKFGLTNRTQLAIAVHEANRRG